VWRLDLDWPDDVCAANLLGVFVFGQVERSDSIAAVQTKQE
jgi:hypothetical protein